MSSAVVYRSVARFASALKQIRSSSFGIASSSWRGGRGALGVVQGVRNGGDQPGRFMKVGAALPDPCRQVARLEILRDNVTETVGGSPHVIDRHDVGMVEARQYAGLVQVGLDILGPGNPFRV